GVLSPVVSLLSYGACPLPAGRFVRSRSSRCAVFAFSFFPVAPPAPIYALSLHDALPICLALPRARSGPLAKGPGRAIFPPRNRRSEEHTSELQSRFDLVCRLLLEKKKLARGTTPSKLYRHPQTASQRRRWGVMSRAADTT